MNKKWFILILLIALLAVACQSESSQEETTDVPSETTEITVSEAQESAEATDTPKPIPTGEVEDYRTSDDSSGETNAAEVEAEATATEDSPAYDLYGGLEPDDFVTQESGLQMYFRDEGDGQLANKGQMVIVNIAGWLEDGSKLMDSNSFGGPIPLPVGLSTGMIGLDEALTYLSTGSSVRVIVPPELVVGEDGSPTPIPAGAVVFEMEVVEILDGPPEAPQAVDEGQYTVTESGLKYVDLAEGAGPDVVAGDRVFVHYTGWLEDNTIFDSSVGRQPFSVVVDSGQVIPGWDEGLKGLKAGGVRQLVIPPELGYGEEGSGSIPPNSVLTFEVELVEIGENPPEAPQSVADEDYTVTDSGLKYYDFEEGQGSEIVNGSQVSVDYTGWLENGTRFDSSIGREPFTLVVGQGQVIAGWEEGLLGLKPGARRQLVIPPELGYGDNGSGPIPDNAVLIFEVEIIDVQ